MDKNSFKKIWDFIWNDDSLLSWIVNILVAFILIKFLVYPGLGLIFGTNYPIVAVVSGSMEHDEGFNAWWDLKGGFYADLDITKEQFSKFPFRNGFNTGDIMILVGTPTGKIKLGDIIVFTTTSRADPIIHRVIAINEEKGQRYFTTKGDHNTGIHTGIEEDKISTDRVIGRAVFRIPYLGWIKIGAVKFINGVSNLVK